MKSWRELGRRNIAGSSNLTNRLLYSGNLTSRLYELKMEKYVHFLVTDRELEKYFIVCNFTSK